MSSTTSTTDVTLEAWLAEAMDVANDATLTRKAASAHVAGNLADMVGTFVRTFVESGDEVASLDADGIIGWTSTRKGRDADQSSLNEANAALKAFTSTFTHPVVVSKHEDAITLTNPLAGPSARDAAMREITRLRVLVNVNREASQNEKNTTYERSAAAKRSDKYAASLADFVGKVQAIASRDAK